MTNFLAQKTAFFDFHENLKRLPHFSQIECRLKTHPGILYQYIVKTLSAIKILDFCLQLFEKVARKQQKIENFGNTFFRVFSPLKLPQSFDNPFLLAYSVVLAPQWTPKAVYKVFKVCGNRRMTQKMNFFGTFRSFSNFSYFFLANTGFFLSLAYF